MIRDFKNKTIFMIDDDIEILEIIKDMINSQFEINVIIFDSPLKALNKLSNGIIPNLFLTDINMPKMNGIKFFEKIKEMKIKKPVIVISGEAERAEAIEFLKLGAFHLLSKPISFDVLANTIFQALTFEEIAVRSEQLASEKDHLIILFQKYANLYEDRVSEIENIMLEKTSLLQEDRNFLKSFLNRIQECSKIDREISKKFQNISLLLDIKNEFISKGVTRRGSTHFKS